MKYLLILILLGLCIESQCQDDLFDLIDEGGKQNEFTRSTFRSTRLVNMHTVETHRKGELQFIIQHRFGRINTGIYELFGLDEANIRFGLEYGVTDNLDLGFGRSSFDKTYDGFAKYRVLRQKKTGQPLSLTLFGSIAINTLRVDESAFEYTFARRTTYATQILIARRFNDRISVEVTPTWVHKNLIESSQDDNDQFAVGFGARIGITNSLDITGEYHYRLNPAQSNITYNSIGFGIDLETGGHVFQIVLSNSRPMIEKGFITETTGDFWKGDIHLGFNIVRRFQLTRS